MSWADLSAEQLFHFWSQRGGAWESVQRDVVAWRKLLEQAEPARVALAAASIDAKGVSAWDVLYGWDDADWPRDRVVVKMELVLALQTRGLLPDGMTVPWGAYMVYRDFAEGLGVPNARFNAAFEAAKQKLEAWFDTDFLTIPTPNRAVPDKRRSSARPRRSSGLKDFGYLE